MRQCSYSYGRFIRNPVWLLPPTLVKSCHLLCRRLCVFFAMFRFCLAVLFQSMFRLVFLSWYFLPSPPCVPFSFFFLASSFLFLPCFSLSCFLSYSYFLSSSHVVVWCAGLLMFRPRIHCVRHCMTIPPVVFAMSLYFVACGAEFVSLGIDDRRRHRRGH